MFFDPATGFYYVNNFILLPGYDDGVITYVIECDDDKLIVSIITETELMYSVSSFSFSIGRYFQCIL